MTRGLESADKWYGGKRVAGLIRFAIAISVLNLLGHTLFGFEQAWAHAFVALGAAYATEILLEFVDARANGRRPAFVGDWRKLVVFLLSAHITGLAVGMLLYAGQRFWVVAFAAATAIASKTLFRVSVPGNPGRPNPAPQTRHFMNPSNFGIAVTLLAFPSVGISPPYQFTENLRGPLDVILPLIIVVSGSLINTKFTDRIPLIVSWLLTFALQALIRGAVNGLPWQAGLVPMTGLAFVLFTFYMVTDPGTTPSSRRSQVIFGSSVALTYAVLMTFHVVFGLFFSLAIVTATRGLLIYGSAVRAGIRTRRAALPQAPSAPVASR
jgi:hypothetical protein